MVHLNWGLALPSGKLLKRERDRYKQWQSKNGRTVPVSRAHGRVRVLSDRADLRKFLELLGDVYIDFTYSAPFNLVKGGSRVSDRFTVTVEGEPLVSFTDPIEALSQAESIRFFGGYNAQVVRA